MSPTPWGLSSGRQPCQPCACAALYVSDLIYLFLNYEFKYGVT